MEQFLTDIIYELLKDKKLSDFSNERTIKNTEPKIYTYYDIENIKHIKIDFGFETYTVTVE